MSILDRKTGLGLFLFAALSFPLAAAPAYTSDLGVSSGILYGTAKEFVYNGAGSSYKVSELDWDLKPLAYFGISYSLNPKELRKSGWFLESTLKAGLPLRSGIITDSDYLNGDGEKTHYSVHDCYSESAVLGDLRFGWSQPQDFSGLALRPYAGISWMHFRWTARDGYLQYGPNDNSSLGWGQYQTWNTSFSKTPVYGTGMEYTQDWMLLTLGAEAAWKASERLDLTAGFAYSPLVYCKDQDNHYLRLLEFTEDMDGGTAFEPYASGELKLGAPLVLGARVSWRSVSGLRGSTTERAIGTTASSATYGDSAGASYAALDVALTLSARF